MLLKVPVPVPSIVFVIRSIVGLVVVLQQTPLEVITEPLSLIAVPPHIIIEPVESLISVNVVTIGFEEIATLSVLGVPEPQELFAVTEIVPPAAPAVAVIDAEVELPLHPDGNIQVYELAPVTGEIL